MNTESDWSSGNRNQEPVPAEKPQPTARYSWDWPENLAPWWTAPPGLMARARAQAGVADGNYASDGNESWDEPDAGYGDGDDAGYRDGDDAGYQDGDGAGYQDGDDADLEAANREMADLAPSDRGVANREAADREVADLEPADQEMADQQMADQQMADLEPMDREWTGESDVRERAKEEPADAGLTGTDRRTGGRRAGGAAVR